MNITAEEKLMYQIMEAIYNSGIPVSFKGSMVLKACLAENGYIEDIRHTVDIDANWISDTPPTITEMLESLQNVINQCDNGLKIAVYREYGEGRSAGFEIKTLDFKEVLFTMDIDVNRIQPTTKIYEINGLHFCGVVPNQMIADKISVISTDKIFRRIKDLVDLYYVSKVFEFDKISILETMNNNCRTVGSFNGFINRTEELRHAYEKFRFEGGVNKPPFDDVYKTVRYFIKDILSLTQE